MHEREQCALGPDDGELEDITVASAARGGLAARWEALAAFFLNRNFLDAKRFSLFFASGMT